MDLDAFFASCEQRDNPEYRGRPVVVGARPGHRGVVAAASYEARNFGIHSAMPISEAYRRCPDAVFLRPDMEKYRRISQQVFRVLDTITPTVEAASIDEAYLDLSGLEKLVGPPQAIGQRIKRCILATTGQDDIGLIDIQRSEGVHFPEIMPAAVHLTAGNPYLGLLA